jgi:hypothetical protein
MGIIYWTGYCNKERVEALTEIEKYIKKHAFLMDFKSFSGNSVSFIIEVDETKLNALYNELKEYMRMDEFEIPDSDSKRESVVLFNLNFTDK